MLETLFILPISFWAVILLLVGGGIAAYRHLDDATGIPLLAVLGTTAAFGIGFLLMCGFVGKSAQFRDLVFNRPYLFVFHVCGLAGIQKEFLHRFFV